MHLSAKNQGAALYLCNLGQQFNEVPQITKLLTVFEVYDTEAAAVASLSKMHESEIYLVARLSHEP
jgi:anti-anti-sigma regulatory factor